MIRTKSAYDPVEPIDGERILVTRFWPRGLSKERLKISEWVQAVAPSRELLGDWKAGRISWEEYEQRYSQEMADQGDAIAALAERAARGTITLLCFEREGDPHCHRHLLRRMIEARM